jgi:hypothetical protein
MTIHKDGTRTVAYVVADGIALDEARTVADAARQAAAGGLLLEDYDGPRGWYIECWTYDADGTPIAEVPVNDGTVREAYAGAIAYAKQLEALRALLGGGDRAA